MSSIAPDYWAVVFVQLGAAIFYVCSWVPMWQLGARVGRFQRPSLNGAFMHHAPMVAALLPGGACLFAGVAALLQQEAHTAAPYAALYALICVQMALFSVWLVPYAVLREAWWSLGALAACGALGVAYTALAGATVGRACAECVTLLALWNAALLGLAALNALWGGARLARYYGSAATAAAFQAAPERAALALNLASPATLARELWRALFCDDDDAADDEGCMRRDVAWRRMDA